MVQATVISAVEVQKCIGTEDRKAIQDPFKKKKISHDGGEGTRLESKPQKWDRVPSS